MAAQIGKDLEAKRFFSVDHGRSAGCLNELPLGVHHEEAGAGEYVNSRLIDELDFVNTSKSY